MTTATSTIRSWMMTSPGQPFEFNERPVGDIPAGEALVRVAGCGVCHTDLSFLHHGVSTRATLPLTLGHEISGTVEAIGDGVERSLLDAPVIVPAVMPCGECEACRAGQVRICPNQIMPGNDRHGGFATHVVVPARYLCPVPDHVLTDFDLWKLAVVADALTTPYQSVVRSGLQAGDLAVVIGAGGIGIHAVQIAAATGAHVVAIDVNPGRLALASAHGAVAALNSAELTSRELRHMVNEAANKAGARSFGWRIFETSGTKPGQETAWSLLSHGSVLAVVGFTMNKLELRLSNLMAFDAKAIGNWGCDARLYPEVVDLLATHRVQLTPFVEAHPLSAINDVFEQAHHHTPALRPILRPDLD